jgi:hypothetical protein
MALAATPIWRLVIIGRGLGCPGHNPDEQLSSRPEETSNLTEPSAKNIAPFLY